MKKQNTQKNNIDPSIAKQVLETPLPQLEAELCRRSFYHFFKTFWSTIIPEDLILNWHIHFLCNKLQEYGEAIINNQPKLSDYLVINISPGTSKSTIASVMFPVWLWIKKQSIRSITGSHSSSLALDMSVKSRDIIRSDKFRTYFPDIKLKEDSDTKSQYQNKEGGGRIATSVGSSAIGKHAHIIIIDDPVSANPSQSEIETANKWITQELATRKIDKTVTPIIIIMQRVAEHDPTGHLLDSNAKVEHICLPAQLSDNISPPELAEKYENGLMDPKRLNNDILQEMRSTLGSRAYDAQFGQTPEPIEGGIIKLDWIPIQRFSESLATNLEKIPPNFYFDTAYTDDLSNDPSAVVITKYFENILYVIHAEQFWKEFPDLVKETKALIERFAEPQSKLYIEPKASGLSLIQQLKKVTNANIVKDKPPVKSKDDRLHAVSPYFEAHRIIFQRAPWNENLSSQLTRLKPTHYDMRDALIMAINNNIAQNSSSGNYSIRTGSRRR